MANKVILVIIDGLANEVGVHAMGFLRSLVESGQGSHHILQCELPSNSRPLYETIISGTRAIEHGVVHNQVNRLSNQRNIFSLAHQHGLTTAAAAYHWFSELCNRSPFVPARDRFSHDPEMIIQHGIFYYQDDYPDSHLYLDAEHLRQTYDPDFLLVHPMGVDNAGHQGGLDSAKYRNAARSNDLELSERLLEWLNLGYQVLVTSDHGMNNDHSHGGNLPSEREIPLWLFGSAFNHDERAAPAQTELCGLVCELLGIPQHGKPTPLHLLKGLH